MADKRKPKRRAGVVAAAVAAAALAACMPLHVPERSPESGVVVDAASRAPLAGARVSLETWEVRPIVGARLKKLETYVVRTDARGRFTIPGKMGWRVVGLSPERAPAFLGRLCIQKKGFAPFRFDPWQATPQASDPFLRTRDFESTIAGMYAMTASTSSAQGACFPAELPPPARD